MVFCLGSMFVLSCLTRNESSNHAEFKNAVHPCLPGNYKIAGLNWVFKLRFEYHSFVPS